MLYDPGHQTRAGVAISPSDKIDFKSKTVTRDKEGHHMMIKWPVHREAIMTVRAVYAPSSREPETIRQTLMKLKGEIDSNAMGPGDLSAWLSVLDGMSTLETIRRQRTRTTVQTGWTPQQQKARLLKHAQNFLQDRAHTRSLKHILTKLRRLKSCQSLF